MTLAAADLYPLIYRSKPFKAGNIFTRVTNGIYAAYSYGEHFPLAVKTEAGWFINRDKFSRSTSRQQSRLGLGDLPDSQPLPTDKLRELVENGDAAHRDQLALAQVTRRLKS